MGCGSLGALQRERTMHEKTRKGKIDLNFSTLKYSETPNSRYFVFFKQFFINLADCNL